ncbi:MAG: hypothetical protein ABIP39_07210 [Polyangiaceae bacterium]
MAIERKNSFHLLLSDDELSLLRLLAEREGLNASDYLRTIVRRMSATPPHLVDVMRVTELMGVKADFGKLKEAHAALSKAKKKTRK